MSTTLTAPFRQLTEADDRPPQEEIDRVIGVINARCKAKRDEELLAESTSSTVAKARERIAARQAKETLEAKLAERDAEIADLREQHEEFTSLIADLELQARTDDRTIEKLRWELNDAKKTIAMYKAKEEKERAEMDAYLDEQEAAGTTTKEMPGW